MLPAAGPQGARATDIPCTCHTQMLTDYNVDLEFKEEDGKDLMEIARDLGYDEIMFHLAKVKGVEPLQTISKAESGQFRQTFSNKYSERPTDEEDLSRPNSNFDSATKERRQQEQSVRRKSREEARIRMRRASSEDGY